MARRLRIEIRGRDEFWARAFHVEWHDQFRERELIDDNSGFFLAEPDWLEDLNRIAEQTFCRIVIAPESPDRRHWITLLGGRRPNSY